MSTAPCCPVLWCKLPRALCRFLSFIGLLVVASQGLGTRFLLPRLGERKTMAACLSAAAFSLFLLGCHASTWYLFFAALIGAPATLFESTVKGACCPVEAP